MNWLTQVAAPAAVLSHSHGIYAKCGSPQRCACMQDSQRTTMGRATESDRKS